MKKEIPRCYELKTNTSGLIQSLFGIFGGCLWMIGIIQYFLFSFRIPLKRPLRSIPLSSIFAAFICRRCSIQYFDHVRLNYHKIRMFMKYQNILNPCKRANTLMNDMHFTQIWFIWPLKALSFFSLLFVCWFVCFKRKKNKQHKSNSEKIQHVV